MLVCAVQTWRTASHSSRLEHKKWAWRLFSLAIGSWLYRVEYGVWGGLFGRTYCVEMDFSGIFDRVMNFFFWIPNLLLVQYLLWKQKQQQQHYHHHGQRGQPEKERLQPPPDKRAPKSTSKGSSSSSAEKEISAAKDETSVHLPCCTSGPLVPAWLLTTTIVILSLVTIFAASGVWIPGSLGKVGPWMAARRDLVLGNWTGDVCLVMGTICVL